MLKNIKRCAKIEAHCVLNCTVPPAQTIAFVLMKVKMQPLGKILQDLKHQRATLKCN